MSPTARPPRTGSWSGDPTRRRIAGTVAAVLALVIASPLRAEPSESSDASTAYGSEVIRGSKGQPVIILAPRPTETGTIRIQFRAGSFDDGFRSGLTRLTQFAMLSSNAVEPYERFILDLFAASGEVSLDTGIRESALTMTAPSSEFEALAERFARLCLAPRVLAAGFEAAKSRTLEGMDGGGTDELVTWLARTVVTEPGYANSPTGDKESIRSMTLGDVAGHLAGPMSPANATVIVAGRFNVEKMRARLLSFHGGRRRAPAPIKTDLAGNYHQKSHLELHVVGYPMTLRSTRDIAAAHLAATILEERIQRQFRRLGIAYSSTAMPVHRDWLDFLLILLPIRSDGEAAASASENLAKEVESVRSGAFLGDELERNQSYLLERFAQVDRDSRQLVREISMGGGDLEWFGPHVAAEVRAMSREQFLQTVRPWLASSASIHCEFSPRAPAAAERRAGR